MTEEEIRAQREQCADCGGALEEINVGQFGYGGVFSPQHIVSNEPKKSIWIGDHYVAVGKILAFMCSSCARVYFYGAKRLPDDEAKIAGKSTEDQ